MKKISDVKLRKTPTAYQKAVIKHFKKDFEDISFLCDINGTTIYAECTDGLVSIVNVVLKELGIENSIN